nr:MAG TPA: hypothetical protein [Caudoviricetes sp.]
MKQRSVILLKNAKNKVILGGRVYSVPMNIFATD